MTTFVNYLRHISPIQWYDFDASPHITGECYPQYTQLPFCLNRTMCIFTSLGVPENLLRFEFVILHIKVVKYTLWHIHTKWQP